MIKVSIIIPIYNSSKYLDTCLNSVLNNSLKDIEVICVDNGSSDNSIEIVNSYIDKDNRVTLLIENNRGAGLARNKGIDNAKGEYIHFLDADDYIEQDAYEKMYSTACEFDADIIKTKAYSFDDKTGLDTYDPFYKLWLLPLWEYNKVLSLKKLPFIICRLMPVVWNGLYKREFLNINNIRFNDLICVNDRSFNIQTLLWANRIVYMKNELIHYRLNNGSSSYEFRAKHFDCLIKSYNLVKDLCDKTNVDENIKRIILNNECHDIKVWYKRCAKYKEYKDSINKQMKELVR